MNCKHNWYVFSTELAHTCLMVLCGTCGAFGTVDDPSKEEWGDAFHAPSNPYKWHANSRVTVRDNNVIYQR